jgi:ubiquinone/menaquinone biosynthesis C-methylase UbiE
MADEKNTNNQVNVENIDWENAWQNKLGKAQNPKKKHWTNKTPKMKFELISVYDEYHEKLIPKLILNENDTVVDLGAGEGAVTSLIAKKVKKVLALDTSEMMLDLLSQRIEAENISNIDSVNMLIEDANIDSIGQFDVVVSSRSLIGIMDLKKTLLNINEIAKKYVFLIVFGRRNWRVEKKFFEEIGKEYPDFAPFDYIFNLLLSMDIYPNVEYFDLVGNRKYDSIDEAFNRMHFKFDLLNDEEKDKIKPFLEKNLFLNPEDGQLENPIDKSDLVLLWWKKDSF